MNDHLRVATRAPELHLRLVVVFQKENVYSSLTRFLALLLTTAPLLHSGIVRSVPSLAHSVLSPTPALSSAAVAPLAARGSGVPCRVAVGTERAGSVGKASQVRRMVSCTTRSNITGNS